jgi:hypothetical protein
MCFVFDFCTAIIALNFVLVWFLYKPLKFFFTKKISNPPAYALLRPPPYCIRNRGVPAPLFFRRKNRGVAEGRGVCIFAKQKCNERRSDYAFNLVRAVSRLQFL